MRAERTVADLYGGSPLRTYKLRRYSRRGLMAEGAEVRVKHETADNVAAFHAVEECTKAIVELKRYHDGPKHAV